jgi:hypothetical protein
MSGHFDTIKKTPSIMDGTMLEIQQTPDKEPHHSDSRREKGPDRNCSRLPCGNLLYTCKQVLPGSHSRPHERQATAYIPED